MKPDDYYSSIRKDIQHLLPEQLGRVLDVGCGRGYFGAQCKKLGADFVAGIEITPENAESAKSRLDEALCGDVETMELPFEPGSFDTIVCADVLEHLRDPWAALEKLKSLLAPSGCLVASIPNVSHYSIILKLLTGSWPYEDSGLLDRTHLRFFGPQQIHELFNIAGLTPEKIAFTVTDEDRGVMEGAKGKKIIEAVRAIFSAFRPDIDTTQLADMDTSTFFIWQFLVRAVMSPGEGNS